MNYAHLLIVTYGRSGSTLLQGLLNSIDGVLIRGENNNFFFRLFEALRDLEATKVKHPGSENEGDPWFGMQDVIPQSFLNDLRPAARNLLIGNHPEPIECLGFKEVRYTRCGDALQDYLDFLRQLFPDACILFNTRDLSEVVRSGWWAEQDPEQVTAELSALESAFRAYADNRPDCFFIDYADLTEQTENLAAMYEFIGAAFDLEKVRSVLAKPHSHTPRQAHVKKMFGESPE
jgi:hypothetical protein